MMDFSGKAHIVGDNINTDYIISSRRKRDTIDPNILKQYFMEDVDPTLHTKIADGDMIVAGTNFGCGSAMEVAATVIKALGVRVILAKSFARSFYRNGINNGIVLIEIDTSSIEDGDEIHVQLMDQQTVVDVVSKHLHFQTSPLPLITRNILTSGGIVPYFKARNEE